MHKRPTDLVEIRHVTSQQEVGFHWFQSCVLLDARCITQQEMKIASFTVSQGDGCVLPQRRIGIGRS